MALEESYNGVGVIPINTVLFGPVDADGSRGLAVQVKSMGTSGSISVQTSMDGVTWSSVRMNDASGGTPVLGMTTQGVFWCNLVGRFYRVILTVATTAGTTYVYTRLNDDDFSELATAVSAAVTTLPAIPAGASFIGSFQANMSANVGLGVNWSIHRLLSSLATTNATSVKASGGRVGKIYGSNIVAQGKYLKLYNKSSAPVVGTDVPVLSFLLRANTDFNFDVADLGVFFSNGIAYAITSSISDGDATAIAAADVIGLNILYI